MAPTLVELATTAVARGTEALAAHDLVAARRWLERAHRLVPHDPNTTLALATACLAADPARAASLFADITKTYDVMQAWLGLAAARLRLDGPEAAAEPLAIALSRHAFSPEVAALARQIGRTRGWCGLRADGGLEIHPAIPAPRIGERIHVTLDGKPVRERKLPPGWESGRAVVVRHDDQTLLGSPIRIDAIRSLAGCIEIHDGGIRGWAWHPGDPDTPPALTLTYVSGGLRQTLVASDESVTVADTGPLARPRSFRLSQADLLNAPGLIHVRGPDGKDLPGSPLNPFADTAASIAAALRLGQSYPAGPLMAGVPVLSAEVATLSAEEPVPAKPIGADQHRAAGKRRGVTVVIPVHDGGAVVLSCLASVLASVPPGTRVLVIDDGSSDPELIAALAELVRQRKITLLRQPRALGFPVSANTGITAATGRDVVLLNSDTLVPPGWLERLRDATYAAENIGTVTPLSNEASILSYPGPAGSNPIPDQAATDRLDRLANRANGLATIDIPVGVGFCLYLRRDCLNATGAFRVDLFAQGYGEENDLCLRARRLGWRNVALTGLFVGHIAGMSFGCSAKHLRQRNGRIIERLHPGYHALIDRFLADDPLAGPRRRIDLLAWKQRGRTWRHAAVLITHNDGGGVEQRLAHAATMHAAAGRRPIILRPAETANGDQAIAVRDGLTDDLPNLVFAVPQELPALLQLLRTARADRIEAHHLADYPPAIYDLVARLQLPFDVHIHDYAWLCPRISLVAANNRYCGEPDLADCEACVADNGSFLQENISVAALRQRSDNFLSKAQRVVVPANDVAARMKRYFPGLLPTIVPYGNQGITVLQQVAVVPGAVPWAQRHDADAVGEVAMSDVDQRRAVRPSPRRPTRPTTGGRDRPTVCVVGAIGVHKGYEVLLACARDAVRRDLDLEFIVVGHTIDDARLMATGRVFVTGRFNPDEAVELIAEQHAHFGFVPSVCPETWCLGLGDLWNAGLRAAAFDIGAPAERIRRTGRGIVLPLGLSNSAINNAFIDAIRMAGHL